MFLFIPVEDILSFFEKTGSLLDRLISLLFKRLGILKLMEYLIGSKPLVRAEGIFIEEKELWQPLRIAYELKTRCILNSIRPGRIYPDEPYLYSYRGEIAIPEEAPLYTGVHGISLSDPATALWRCLGEAVERFSVSHLHDRSVRYYTFKQIKHKALNLFSLPNISDVERKALGENTLSEDAVFGWVRGVSLSDRSYRFVPAQIVYANYKRIEGEPLIRKYVTTGAASNYGYNAFEKAVIHGIFEILEREAFIISWLNMLALPAIPLDKLNNGAIKELINKIKRYHLEVRVLDMSTDLNIPSSLCIIRDDSENPPISMGAAVDFDWDSAILRSLEEAIGVRRFMRKIKTSYERGMLSFSTLPTSLYERALYWMQDDNVLNKMQFYFDGQYRLPTASSISSLKSLDPRRRLFKLVSFLQDFGMEVIVVDITPLELKGTLWSSVSVVIPQAAGFWLDERYPLYNCVRITEVPVRKGFRLYPMHPDEFNKLPHPFL
jgi:ribosomal protein S12 methylthiotransferase accessory factor